MIEFNISMWNGMSRTIEIFLKRSLRHLAAVMLMLPAMACAADMLLDEAALAEKLANSPEYQLLDARSAEAQHTVPLAFSTRYRALMPIKMGTVFVIADRDEAALEIAEAIPAEGRSVFAVKGGAAAWKQVVAKMPAGSAMPDSFVIPKNTCEPGKPVQELKSDTAIQRENKK